jgi:hypothetical protein
LAAKEGMRCDTRSLSLAGPYLLFLWIPEDWQNLEPEKQESLLLLQLHYQILSQAKKPCPESLIQVNKAEQIVWEWLTALLSMDEDRLRIGLNGLAQIKENKVESKCNRIEVIDSQITNITNKIGGLMHAFDGDEDADVVAQLKIQVDQLKKTKKDLRSQRERIKAEVSMNTITTEQIDIIVIFAKTIKGKLEKAKYNHKKEIIDTLNVRINVAGNGDNRRLDMSCDLPGSDYSEVIG